MKLSLAVVALLAGSTAFAFAPHSTHHHLRRPSSSSSMMMMSFPPGSSGDSSNNNIMPSSPQPKKVLTAADVMAKSKSSSSPQSSANDAAVTDSPQIFAPAIYDDFQSALLLLEKRITSGPSSLTKLEFQQFEEQTSRIVMEMKEYLNDPVGRGEAIRRGYQQVVVENAADATTSMTITPPDTPIATTPATTTAIPTLAQLETSIIINQVQDANNNNIANPEGDVNEDYANFGLARGTTNTYVIPGMEEMSPEEYRSKLQETISARQAERRRQSLSSGIIGNRSSTGYLDGLNRVGGAAAADGAQGDGGAAKVVAGKGGEGWGGGAMYKRQQGENTAHPIVMDDDDDDANSANVLNGEEEGGGSSGLVRNSSIGKSQLSIMVEAMGGGEIEESSRLSAASSPPIHHDMDEEEEPPHQQQHQERTTSNPEVLAPRPIDESFKSESLMLTMRQSKLHGEQMRKSEWQVDAAATAAGSEGSDELDDGEQTTSDTMGEEDPTTLSMMSPTNKNMRIPSSPSSHHGSDPPSRPASNLFNIDDWWRKPQKRQRPISTNYDRKSSFFQVHTVSTLVEKTIQASVRVSTESTQSFAHGNEENSLRPKPVPSAGGDQSRFFRVHDDAISTSIPTKNPPNVQVSDHRGPGDVKPPRNRLTESSFKSLIEMEERVRPIPSTVSPKYAKFIDHRDVGDGTDPQRIVQKHRTANSLVGIEEQIRPVAPSAIPEYTRIKDHRSTGDTKVAKRSKLSALTNNTSLIETKGRVRPVSTSHLFEHIQFKDHRSAGDTKVAKRSKSPTQMDGSLIETEGRVRPVVSSSHLPEYAQVRDRRSVGDTRKLSVRLQHRSPPAKSLIEGEESIRPVSSSSSSYSSSIDQNLHVHVIDHRGPGDDNALTRRAQQQQPSPIAPSLSESEQRVRPIPSSHQFQDFQVGDHRGPGDTNALTKRVESTLSSTSTSDVTSLSADEQRQRPVPTSGLNQSLITQIGDYRGPGDTSRTTTEKLSSALLSNDDRIADGCWWDEQTQRPTPIHASLGNEHGLVRTMDGSQRQVNYSSPTLLTNKPPGTLTSLLKEEKKDFLSDRNKKQAIANNPPPIAAIPPSSLHSLLKEDERSITGSGSTETNANPRLHLDSREPRSLSSLSLLSKTERQRRRRRITRSSSPDEERPMSLSSSSANRTDEWWNEKPRRPRNYVQHFQPMNASYTKKWHPPRDYGDVVTASNDEDDVDKTNQ